MYGPWQLLQTQPPLGSRVSTLQRAAAAAAAASVGYLTGVQLDGFPSLYLLLKPTMLRCTLENTRHEEAQALPLTKHEFAHIPLSSLPFTPKGFSPTRTDMDGSSFECCWGYF